MVGIKTLQIGDHQKFEGKDIVDLVLLSNHDNQSSFDSTPICHSAENVK